ncbi:hypothetical protein N8996_04405 [Candidatus Poseidonia alphae]|nr:hypothetical protein [Candidatus Poseidonia alphae]
MCAGIKPFNYLINKEDVEESLFQYNAFHLANVDFDHPLMLMHQVTPMENITYMLGCICSMLGIYYFIVETIKSFNKN